MLIVNNDSTATVKSQFDMFLNKMVVLPAHSDSLDMESSEEEKFLTRVHSARELPLWLKHLFQHCFIQKMIGFIFPIIKNGPIVKNTGEIF